MLKILTRDQGGKNENPDQVNSRSDQSICSFDQFKLIVLSLFGIQIFELSDR